MSSHDGMSLEYIAAATAANAAHFLDALERRMPFPVKAIQVDGGSEFEALFEEECQRRGIKLFVLTTTLTQAQWWCGKSPPHSHRGVLRSDRQHL